MAFKIYIPTFVENAGLENINNFTLKIFATLDLRTGFSQVVACLMLSFNALFFIK